MGLVCPPYMTSSIASIEYSGAKTSNKTTDCNARGALRGGRGGRGREGERGRREGKERGEGERGKKRGEEKVREGEADTTQLTDSEVYLID